MAVIGSPNYPKRHGVPTTPRDLRSRRRINVRLPTAGTIYTWEFERGAEKRDVAVDGPRTTSMPGAGMRARAPVARRPPTIPQQSFLSPLFVAPRKW